MADVTTDEQKKVEAEKAAAAKRNEAAKKKAEQDATAAPKKTSKTFFRSTASGLTILKANGDQVRFTARWDKFKGDDIKVGFLETDDAAVVKQLEGDPNVEKISEKEFKESEDLRTVPSYSA